MIYAHYDIRYVMHAFPDVYANYVTRAQDLHDFYSSGYRWSFREGTEGGLDPKLRMLDKWMRKELDYVSKYLI